LPFEDILGKVTLLAGDYMNHQISAVEPAGLVKLLQKPMNENSKAFTVVLWS